MLTRDRGPFPIAAAAEAGVDRRRFLRAAGAAMVAAACGQALARSAEEQGSSSPLVAAAALAGIAAGEARLIAAEERQVLAVGLASGEVVAFDRRCPHLGCPVIWAAERGRFECPCHHAAFDARTGAVLFGPPRRGLTPAVVQA